MSGVENRDSLSEQRPKRSEDGFISKSAEATVLSVSNKGLLLEAECPLKIDDRADIVMAWPALLDGHITLQLHITGRVLRMDTGSAGITIDKYEFRTRRKESTLQMVCEGATRTRSVVAIAATSGQ